MASDSGTWVSQTEQAIIFCPASLSEELLKFGCLIFLNKTKPTQTSSITNTNLIIDCDGNEKPKFYRINARLSIKAWISFDQFIDVLAKQKTKEWSAVVYNSLFSTPPMPWW